MRTLRGEKDWEIPVFWDTLNACHSLEQEKSEKVSIKEKQVEKKQIQ